MDTQRRTCKQCRDEKDLIEFQVCSRQNGKEYRLNTCKACSAPYNLKYSQDPVNREKAKTRMRERRKEGLPREQLSKLAEYQRGYRRIVLAQVVEAYGGKCACCGEDDPRFLAFDHVNNDGAVARKTKKHPPRGEQLYKWLIKNGYPSDFQLLCYNCNWGKARNGGVCPHQAGSTTRAEARTPQAIGGGSAKPLH